MKKTIPVILVLLLMFQVVYPNPVPVKRSNKYIFPIISGIVTLFLGFNLFKAIITKNEVEFIDEKIDISVTENGSVEIVGEYRFLRIGEGVNNYKVIFPFPMQKKFGEVDVKYVLINERNADYIPFEIRRKNQVSLELFFDEKDVCVLKIKFVQKPLQEEYKYILKTTKFWKKALESTEINLSFTENFELKKCNYRLNTIKIDNEIEGSQLIEKDFYPYKDFVFSWSKK